MFLDFSPDFLRVSSIPFVLDDSSFFWPPQSRQLRNFTVNEPLPTVPFNPEHIPVCKNNLAKPRSLNNDFN